MKTRIQGFQTLLNLSLCYIFSQRLEFELYIARSSGCYFGEIHFQLSFVLLQNLPQIILLIMFVMAHDIRTLRRVVWIFLWHVMRRMLRFYFKIQFYKNNNTINAILRWLRWSLSKHARFRHIRKREKKKKKETTVLTCVRVFWPIKGCLTVSWLWSFLYWFFREISVD